MGKINISDIADMEALTHALTIARPHATLRQWADTAMEIAPAGRLAIENVRSIYAEMDEHELDINRLLGYVEALLERLENTQQRASLISIEAPNARR